MSYSAMFILLYLTMHLHCVFPNVSDEKIIGGTCIDIRSARYILSFRINGDHKCGAAILKEDWAVTAAHCVIAANSMEEITVCSGMTKLDGTCNAHYVINFIIHENYSVETNDFDIALIQVNPPFIFNDCTKAVDIAPNNDREIFKEYATACGWGYYSKFYWIYPMLSECLRCIVIPLINRALCEQDYRDKTNYVVTSQMTCYGFQDGREDTCKGDSGGPLVNKNNILIGITSWGSGCAEERFPGVYTDAICLKNWIRENIEKKA